MLADRAGSEKTSVRAKTLLGGLLDQLIHPGRDEESDPGRPFTPPPSQPSESEKEDGDDDGPSFPMNPALA